MAATKYANTMTERANQLLINFYNQKEGDSYGRQLDEILRWSAGQLENTHNYIQWLFPITDTGFNSTTPLLNAATIEVFKQQSSIQTNLLRSLNKMLDFYGLTLHHNEPDQVIIERSAEHFACASRCWLTPGNHNYLRFTRIIKSLCQLGLTQYAEALFNCLQVIFQEHSSTIGLVTYQHWQQALTDNRDS
ncbi:hypothetical protein H0A36_22205 [Endozoicomonas sp. SM1973]|uniref:Opioid growth factor receptor (OGFr) conserved domain-containing protein n=1 Tax=Spartinivicinus marinus TaxID=2994442 RepID=A0A853I5W8_9GAMM|nr:opioid growth factor receptor-related protein [Spartinivicinus marinus]MCX4024782.1 opioid growth factor receptor-related protein [Spartinivicinus marinus]NYZ68733.1 hypothetical protein [Spartinivicinus marinus]